MPTIAFSNFKGIIPIEFIHPHVILNTYDIIFYLWNTHKKYFLENFKF